MSLDTLPRSLDFDREFESIARHVLNEPTQPLPFTPRSNVVPRPRQPIDDLPPRPLEPLDTYPETRRPGIHRAPRRTIIEWLGSRTARVTSMAMLAASIALQGTGNWLENSLEKQTVYSTALDESNLSVPGGNLIDVIDRPPPTTSANPPKATPAKPHTVPKPTTPTATAKKPTPAITDNWPAPGTNCNYLPKHQHKASETSRAQTKAIFKKMVIACFGIKEWPAANKLWTRESDFNPVAVNPESGACLVVQALPCRKALRATGASSVGNTTVEKQARWGNGYIKERYGTPTKAWRHWRASVNINGREVGHWY